METYYENNKEYLQARQYAKLALQTADSIGYTLVVADAYNDLGDIVFKYKSNLDSALYFYNIALNKATDGSYRSCGKYVEGVVDAYNKIGNVYKRKGKKDKAYENHFHALEIAKEISYQEGIINAVNGIRAVNGLSPITMPKNEKEKNEMFLHLYKNSVSSNATHRTAP